MTTKEERDAAGKPTERFFRKRKSVQRRDEFFGFEIDIFLFYYNVILTCVRITRLNNGKEFGVRRKQNEKK